MIKRVVVLLLIGCFSLSVLGTLDLLAKDKDDHPLGSVLSSPNKYEVAIEFTYYKGTRRHAAAQRLWLALHPDGALMIGCKEDLRLPERDLFEPWPNAEGIFRRKKQAWEHSRFIPTLQLSNRVIF